MTYTPTKWKKGDVVTSVGLNNIEDELVELDSAKQDGGVGYYEEGHLVDQTIPVADWESEGGEYYANITLSEMPVVGQEYKIVIDGVETTVICAENDGEWILCENPDDPYFPAIVGTDTSGNVYITTAPTTDVHVELIGQKLHQIGGEFINHGNFFIEATYDNGTYTLDKTWSEIAEMIQFGCNIVIQSVIDDPFAITAFLFVGMYELSGDYYVDTIYNNAGTPTVAQFIANDPDEALSYEGVY